MFWKTGFSILKLCVWLATIPVIIFCVFAHSVLAVVDAGNHAVSYWAAPSRGFRHWSMNHLLSWSQKFNIWHGGDPDETFSSRVGKENIRASGASKYWRFWWWFLNKFEKNHALNAIEDDEGDDQVLRF